MNGNDILKGNVIDESVYFQAYKKIRKEFHAVQAALLCGSRFTFSPRFDNVRYFNTTCCKFNKQPSNESNPEKSDKEPNKDEEMKAFLRKLLMWLLLLYVVLIALRYQMDTSSTEVSFCQLLFYTENHYKLKM